MGKASNPSANQEVARRLTILRHAVAGESQTAFAQRVGIEVKRWNNFERSLPLSKDVAIMLVRKFPGLTLDWLFLGIEDGLPVKLQRELAEAGKSTTSDVKGRG